MPTDGFKLLEVPIPGLGFLRKLIGGGAVTSSLGPVGREGAKPGVRKRLRQWIAGWQRRYGIAYGCRMPDPMDLWSSAAFRAVKFQEWDLVVSTAGPYCVHAPAYALRSKGLAKRWVADWRDLWVDNHIYPGLPGVRAIERWLERRWCTRADAITTVSQPLADLLHDKYGDKVHVIYNGFDPEDYQQLPAERAFPPDGILRIVYTGTIYPGYQDPTPLFRALGQLAIGGILGPDRFQVLFCGNNANVNELAGREGVAEYVQYLGFVPRYRALQMQRDASALLFLEFESDSAGGILTGKLFEYLFAGPPILAVGGALESSVGKVLSDTDRGVVCGRDVDLIKSALMNLLEQAAHKVASPEVVMGELQKYTRAEQARGMLNLALHVEKMPNVS